MAVIEGDLPKNIGIPQALEAVAHQGKSGILTVQGTEDIVGALLDRSESAAKLLENMGS